MANRSKKRMVRSLQIYSRMHQGYFPFRVNGDLLGWCRDGVFSSKSPVVTTRVMDINALLDEYGIKVSKKRGTDVPVAINILLIISFLLALANLFILVSKL